MNSKFSLRLYFTFALIAFLPSLVFVAASASSLAAGLVMACLLIFSMNISDLFKTHIPMRHVAAFFLIFISLLLWGSYQYFSAENTKPLYSTLVMMAMIVSCYSVSVYLNKISVSEIRGAVFAFSLTLLALGWAKFIFIVPIFGYNLYPKAVPPFSEESHYALVAGFFFCVYSFIGGKWKSIFFLLNSIFMAIMYPSLTMLVFSLLMILIVATRLRPLAFMTIGVSAFAGMSAVVVLYAGKIPYFSSRLNFSGAENLTTLVFLQGWELARLNLFQTLGLGLGFQMLGSSETIIGPLTLRVMKLAAHNRALNLSDGGFLAAKLIAEYGVLGVFVLIFYVFYLVRGVAKVNRMRLHGMINNFDQRDIIYFAFIFSSLVEVFLRGYGYFSPSVFLVLSCVLAMRKTKSALDVT